MTPTDTPSPEYRRRWARLTAALAGLGLAAFGLSQLGLFGNPGCSLPTIACARVLFIGNSYTYVNDLPTTFADLAWAGGRRVETRTLATGGETLAGHVADPATATTIASESWDTVVLQEQSQNPAVASYRQTEMYPAVARLVDLVRSTGGQPLLFLTWAHESGWPEAGLPTYASMQGAVDEGYKGIGSLLAIPIAPVGDAWQTAVAQGSSPGLWQSDGVHPTAAGTYLAACVFYAAIFRQSPVGLTYRDTLSDASAAFLQRVAAATVLGDRAKWGL